VPKQTTSGKFFENLSLSFKNFAFSKFKLIQKYLVLIPAGMGHFMEYGMAKIVEFMEWNWNTSTPLIYMSIYRIIGAQKLMRRNTNKYR
jgi:hypothetical protein